MANGDPHDISTILVELAGGYLIWCRRTNLEGPGQHGGSQRQPLAS
jgi:hypothetical protein